MTITTFVVHYLSLLIMAGAGLIVASLPGERRTSYVLTGCFAALLAIVLTQAAGIVYVDPRHFTRGIPASMLHVAGNGFPSDHTVVSVAAALLAWLASRRVGGVLIVLAAVVGLARITTGLCSPIDVVAGATIAVLAVMSASLVQVMLDRRVWGAGQ